MVDESTVKLQLFNPFRPLLPQLGSDRMGFMVSPSAVEKYGGGRDGNFGRNPVGTGPFRFVEWVPQDHILLKRNSSYWEEGKPYLDAIRYQAIKEPSVRLAMLRTGETDVIYNGDVTGDDVPLIERNPGLKVLRLPGTSTYMLHFNPSKPPFNNKALRQAVGHAMNRENFVKAVIGGAGTPAYTLVATGWAYNPDLKPIEFDLAKVKQKLTEAGYPKGVTIPMGCPSTGIYLQVCEFAQAMGKEAGIDIEIKLQDYTDYFLTDDKGFLKRWGFGDTQWFFRVDPHTMFQLWFHSKGSRTAGMYSNPEVDRLVEEAAAIYDTAKARPLYDRIQTITAEDAVLLYLARGTGLFPISKRVQGFAPYPMRFEHLEFVWLEK